MSVKTLADQPTSLPGSLPLQAAATASIPRRSRSTVDVARAREERRARMAARHRAGLRREYMVLFALTFVFFFVVACLTRLLPRGLDPVANDAGPRRSVFAEARTAARATIGYAFMG